MRAIKLSRTFNDELAELLAQGIDRFGAKVVGQKRALVFHTIENFIAHHPVRPIDPDLGICAYPLSGAPFIVIYDYDDHVLRVHLIIHAKADRRLVDLSTVVW